MLTREAGWGKTTLPRYYIDLAKPQQNAFLESLKGILRDSLYRKTFDTLNAPLLASYR